MCPFGPLRYVVVMLAILNAYGILIAQQGGTRFETGEAGELFRSGYPTIKDIRVKTRINRRGGSGEGRERKGDCEHTRAVHSFVVQVISRLLRAPLPISNNHHFSMY